MTTRLHVGSSRSPNVEDAVAEAAGGALAEAAHPSLAIVLATDRYDAVALAAAVSDRLGNLPWAGCSAAGVFAGTEVIRDGLVIGIVSSREAYVGLGAAGPVSQNARSSGQAAVMRALDQLPAASANRSRALLVFLDALGGHGAEVVRGAAREGGSAAAWAGAGAGDNLRFMRTAQFARGKAFFDSTVVAALELPGRFGVAMRHGWRPYGSPTTVTRARGPVAVDLEYEPAFEVYRRTAALHGDVVERGEFAAFAMTHPLGFPQADGEHVIRDPLAVEEDGGLRCIAEIPDGALVRVMEGGEEALVDAAAAAAASARAAVGGPLAGALVFDCVSRFLVLGERFGRELEAFRSALGPEVPMMGCLSFGEVGALGAGLPQFHNKTAAVLALPA